jgi:threonine dehydrogenase-like Zn-dependent dehydrogenase
VLNLDDLSADTDLVAHIRGRTGGRGPDAVIDAVGMEAHGSPAAKIAHKMTEFIPNALAERAL